jgi:transcription elongation factor Elf1
MNAEAQYWVPFTATKWSRLHTSPHCTHFGLDEANAPHGQPPRLATEDEAAALLVCSSCGGGAGIAGSGRSATARARPPVEQFTCPVCGLRKSATSRQGDGMCVDCAQDY